MDIKPEHPKKRRDVALWRVSRLYRLKHDQAMGRATERQIERINQLQKQVDQYNRTNKS